jgi:hypothetical protein
MNAVELLKELWEKPEEQIDKRRIVLWIRQFENDCWLVEVENNMYQVVRPENREWEDRPVCRKCRQ